MEGGSGPRSGVHNKQMFIIGGFTISDPDCSYTNECELKMYVDSDGYYRKPHRIAVA